MAVVFRGTSGRTRRCPRCKARNDIRATRCEVCGETLSKFRNVKVRMDGFAFDSKMEAARYLQLLMRQKNREISGLTVHPRFLLKVNDEKVCAYIADFQYWVCHSDIKGSCMVVEDVKGKKTRDYVIKRKLMKAVLGIEVKEIQYERRGRKCQVT